MERIDPEIVDNDISPSNRNSKKRKKYGKLSDVNKLLNLRSHTMGQDCRCKRLKCFERIPENARNKIIQSFNLLNSVDEQNIYLCGLITTLPIKQRRPRQHERDALLHDASFRYRVRVVDNINGHAEDVEICKKAFISIHGIGRRKLAVLQQSLKLTGDAPKDRRGKHTNRPHKLSIEAKSTIKSHIGSFRGRKSHYSMHDTAKHENTGGGPSTPLPLSDVEKRLLAVMGNVAVEGDTGVAELGLQSEVVTVGDTGVLELEVHPEVNINSEVIVEEMCESNDNSYTKKERMIQKLCHLNVGVENVKKVYSFRQLNNMSSGDLFTLLENIPSDSESNESSSEEDDLLDIANMPILFEDQPDQPSKGDNAENILGDEAFSDDEDDVPPAILRDIEQRRTWTNKMSSSESVNEPFSASDSEYEPENNDDSTESDSDSADKRSKLKLGEYKPENNDDSTESDSDRVDESSKLKLGSTTKHVGRKRNREPSKHIKNVRKEKRNCGEQYVSTSNKVVKAKEFHNRECTCKGKCIQKISQEERKAIFTNFWNIANFSAQNAFLVGIVKLSKPATHRPRNGTRQKKAVSYTYVLNTPKESHKVCKMYFLETFAISNGRLMRALKKGEISFPGEDLRGKHAPSNKTPEGNIQLVRDHINSFPSYESHYTRAHNPNRKFLDPELNVRTMYTLYKEKCVEDPVSESLYRQIFHRDFNLHFHVPLKDTCVKCDKYKNQVTQEKDENTKKVLQSQHELHLRRSEKARAALKDAKITSIREKGRVCAFTFDLEKALPFPTLTCSVAYYKRNMYVYNLGDTEIYMINSAQHHNCSEIVNSVSELRTTNDPFPVQDTPGPSKMITQKEKSQQANEIKQKEDYIKDQNKNKEDVIKTEKE
ncbi:unnamed protein product [Diabrotica balteata]|uniref:Uncharacterized protein n=1 Tax=Diabrotica balteata TaxID=107213 RepID=A0A9N9XI40_DIABA|nr:unnamed protein product [Diabrotica balteata]